MGHPDQRLLGWLQAIDLSRVAISAALDEHGNLNPVGGMDAAKPLAAFEQAAKLGGPRVLIVSNHQVEIAEGDPRLEPDAFPLRIIKAPDLKTAVERLYEDDGPRHAVREWERNDCGKLELIDGRKVALEPPEGESLYQELPLLREVKPDELPRSRRLGGEDDTGERSRSDGQLADSEILRWEESLRDERIPYKRLKLDEVFTAFGRAFPKAKRKIPRFVLIAPPGAGKTTLAQVAVYRAAIGALTLQGARLLPARVRLRDWQAWATKPNQLESGLPEYLAQDCYKDLKLGPAPTSEQWRRWLKDGDVLLLLDGLDEIDAGPAFQKALRSAFEAFDKCPTIITCRTVSFEQHSAAYGDFQVATLDGLDDRSRDAYIKAYPKLHPHKFHADRLIEQLNRQPAMRPLAANPLLLNLLCYVVDDPLGVELPATRGELYDLALTRLVDRNRGISAGYPSTVSTATKRWILERTALELFAGAEGEHHRPMDEDQVLRALRIGAKVEGQPMSVADALLKDATSNCGILREDAHRRYSFLHLTVQEFLAASALARVVNDNDPNGWETELTLGKTKRSVRASVDKKAWDPRWREVICMLTGRLEEPEFLLKILGDPKPTATNPEGDDAFHHRLALAAAAMAEIPELTRKDISNTIRDMTTRVFAFWWQGLEKSEGPAHAALRRALPSLALLNANVPAGRLPDKWVGLEQRPAGVRTRLVRFLDRIAELLRHRSFSVRLGAAEAVRCLGPTAATERILAQIGEMLRSADSLVRSCALQAVQGLGTRAATDPMLTQVAEMMHDRDRDMQFTAITVLGRLGAAAATDPNLAQIAVFLRDPERWIRDVAAEAVRGLGAAAATEPMLAQVAEMLRHPDPDVRDVAVRVIKGLGAAAATDPILAQVAEMLRDPDQEVRSTAGLALACLGGAAATEPFFERIDSLLQDPDVEMRCEALRAVGSLGAAVAERFMAQIGRSLRDPDRHIRTAAVLAVGGLGATAATEPILARAVELLRDPVPGVRGAAAVGVAFLGAAAATEPLLAQILDLLRDTRSDVLFVTARVVQAFGSAAATEPILARIAHLLHHPDPAVRSAAARAAGGIGAAAATDPILAQFAALLRHADQSARKGAAEAVGGRVALRQIEKLRELTYVLPHDTRADVRSAVHAVGRLGPAAATIEPIVDQIVVLLHDPDPEMRAAAALAVGKLGVAARTEPHLARIADMLGDPVEDVRSAAVNAVEHLGARVGTEPFLAHIAVLLQGHDIQVRRAAADAIAQMHAAGLRLFANPRRARRVEELSR
jgi:HEAT repeat protein